MAGGDQFRQNHHHSSAADQHRRAQEVRLLDEQSREIQTLLHDNQRLAATHVTLSQQVSATEQEVRLLSATANSVKAEREAQVREFYDRSFKLETEARSISELPAELERARANIKDLRAQREEMLGKLKDIDGDLLRTHLELEELAELKADIEAMRNEIQRGRAAVDYEREMSIKNQEISEVMEKHMASLSQEAQKLRSERADAENRAMIAAAVTAPGQDPGYGYAVHHGGPEPVSGGNPVFDPSAVDQACEGQGEN